MLKAFKHLEDIVGNEDSSSSRSGGHRTSYIIDGYCFKYTLRNVKYESKINLEQTLIELYASLNFDYDERLLHIIGYFRTCNTDKFEDLVIVMPVVETTIYTDFIEKEYGYILEDIYCDTHAIDDSPKVVLDENCIVTDLEMPTNWGWYNGKPTVVDYGQILFKESVDLDYSWDKDNKLILNSGLPTDKLITERGTSVAVW